MKKLLPLTCLLLATHCLPLFAQTTPALPVPLSTAMPDVVATVGRQTVTRSEYLPQLRNSTPNPESADAGLPAGRVVLQKIITGKVYVELAGSEGVAPTDAEVDDQYNNIKLIQDATNIKTFEERLTEKGFTPQDLKDLQIRPHLAQVKLLTRGTPVPTESQIQAYYDQYKADQYTKPDRAHVRGIALATKAQALQIARKIQNGKKLDDFLSRSLNTQLPNGEFQQWVPLDASKYPELSPLIKNIRATAIGKTTLPFQFQNAWWLVQVMERKQKEVIPLEQLKGLIPFAIMEQSALPQKTDSQTVLQQKQQKFTDVQQQVLDYQTKLATTGQIQIDLPGKQYVDLLNDLKKSRTAP